MNKAKQNKIFFSATALLPGTENNVLRILVLVKLVSALVRPTSWSQTSPSATPLSSAFSQSFGVIINRHSWAWANGINIHRVFLKYEGRSCQSNPPSKWYGPSFRLGCTKLAKASGCRSRYYEHHCKSVVQFHILQNPGYAQKTRHHFLADFD